MLKCGLRRVYLNILKLGLKEIFPLFQVKKKNSNLLDNNCYSISLLILLLDCFKNHVEMWAEIKKLQNQNDSKTKPFDI